jgi:hypothetical protein
VLLEEWKPTPKIAQAMKRYIDNRLNWRPGRNDTIGAELFLQFGELYITLTYRKSVVKVPLLEIET